MQPARGDVAVQDEALVVGAVAGVDRQVSVRVAEAVKPEREGVRRGAWEVAGFMLAWCRLGVGGVWGYVLGIRQLAGDGWNEDGRVVVGRQGALLDSRLRMPVGPRPRSGSHVHDPLRVGDGADRRAGDSDDHPVGANLGPVGGEQGAHKSAQRPAIRSLDERCALLHGALSLSAAALPVVSLGCVATLVLTRARGSCGWC